MAPEELVAEPGRLDVVVSALTGAGRADVQRAIAAGLITVDGQIRPKSHRLQGGERVLVDLAVSTEILPEGPPVPVRFEDDHLAVLAKPAGVVVHPTEARPTGTLVNRLLGMGIALSDAGGPLRPGIVHRLDAGTSGLMVIAKTDEAYADLVAMLRRHEVERRYLALVRGAVANAAFAVEAPLGRRAQRVVVDRTQGREAETEFATRERFARATLLEATPRTGRTHQIRVHLAAIGHPILGDRAYGGAGEEARALGLTRPFLHSWRIAFLHPVTGERIDLEEPLPEDLASAMGRLRDQRP